MEKKQKSEKNNEKLSLSKSVIKVISEMKSGEQFYGKDLQKRVSVYYPKAKKKYTETILRVARKYCRDEYKCLKASVSLYQRV